MFAIAIGTKAYKVKTHEIRRKSSFINLKAKYVTSSGRSHEKIKQKKVHKKIKNKTLQLLLYWLRILLSISSLDHGLPRLGLFSYLSLGDYILNRKGVFRLSIFG